MTFPKTPIILSLFLILTSFNEVTPMYSSEMDCSDDSSSSSSSSSSFTPAGSKRKEHPDNQAQSSKRSKVDKQPSQKDSMDCSDDSSSSSSNVALVPFFAELDKLTGEKELYEDFKKIQWHLAIIHEALHYMRSQMAVHIFQVFNQEDKLKNLFFDISVNSHFFDLPYPTFNPHSNRLLETTNPFITCLEKLFNSPIIEKDDYIPFKGSSDQKDSLTKFLTTCTFLKAFLLCNNAIKQVATLLGQKQFKGPLGYVLYGNDRAWEKSFQVQTNNYWGSSAPNFKWVGFPPCTWEIEKYAHLFNRFARSMVKKDLSLYENLFELGQIEPQQIKQAFKEELPDVLPSSLKDIIHGYYGYTPTLSLHLWVRLDQTLWLADQIKVAVDRTTNNFYNHLYASYP